MRSFFAWLVLLAVGLLLIAIGFTGKLGSALGALLTPGWMEDVPS